MKRLWIGACIMLASCGQKPAPLPDPDALGLIEAPAEHPVVGAAIKRAAKILGATPKVRLYPGWDGRQDGVPVYALSRESLAVSETIGTYDECGCVLMSMVRLNAWLIGQMGTGVGRLDIDRTALLTYMLLHEAGHVAQGKSSCGIVLGGRDDGDARLNMTDTAQKACERSADAFASDAVRAAIAKGADQGIAGNKVAIALSQLAFNLQARRMLDRFGENAVRSPSLFRDLGLSHPNLEWRILSANAMIARTPVAEELLREFENVRKQGPVRIGMPSLLAP